MNPIKVCLLFLCLLATFSGAQTANELVGSWQAQVGDVIATMNALADGTYTFEIPSQNYFEQGTWQFDGTNFSQQWTDATTGEAMNETYLVEFLDANSFRQSGGNLNGQILTFVRTNVQAAPAQPVTSSPDLVGVWEAIHEGDTITQVIQADGTYTFTIPGDDEYETYFEEGRWQLDGMNLSQQYQDPSTGEALNEAYAVEFLDGNTFRQSGGNLGTVVYTFTRVSSEVASTQTSTPEQTATNPVSTPATQNTPALTPEQLAAQGINPETMLIPDTFHCYLDEYSDDYSQFDFALTILPNWQYSTDVGTGDYEIVGDLPVEVKWLSGPFASEDAYAFANYDNYGQTISLHEIGAEGQDFNCYQRGSKEEQVKLELAFKDPQPGTVYSCVDEDDGTPATLEMLENRIYRVDGMDGDYTVDLMNDPESDSPGVDYLSGPWADSFGSISANEETGQREISATSHDATFDFVCSFLGSPLQGVQYGSATAAPPPAGAGGLEGFYANWEPDMSGMGLCTGGICWDYFYFFANGYVYTEKPEGLLEQIDCTRTQPNGAPLCDTYTLQGSTIYFSDGEAQSFAQTAEGLEIDGNTYSRIPRFDGLLLNGVFEASSFAPTGQGGVAIQKTITFSPDGSFTRQGFAGGSYSSNGTGVTATSEGSDSGTYQIQGNAITFNYSDGQMVSDFFFVIPGEDPNNPGAIRIGVWDFLRQ
jgi:hypothetical protein